MHRPEYHKETGLLTGGAPEHRDLLLVALLTLATRTLFIYQRGMPDPDAIAMIAGMALGMSGNVPLGDAVLYGRNVNPGMHWLVVHLFPLLHISPAHLLLSLNWLSVVCASLLVFPLYALIRPHFSHRVSIACILIWVTTPVVWESGTYYHPLIPAMLLLLLAIVCSERIAATPRGIAWLVMALIFGCAALVLRVELAIVWPAFLVWTLTSKSRVRNTAVMLALSGCAVAAYLLGAHSMSDTSSGPTLGPAAFARMVRGMYIRSMNLRGLPRSVTWMASAIGVATLGSCATGLARRGRPDARDARRITAAAIAWALPSILFWLPQPVPILRHYLLASMGLIVLLGAWVLAGLDRRRLVAVAATIAMLNLLVPEIAYRSFNARTSVPKTPHGAFFYYHNFSMARIDRDNSVAQQILRCGTPNGPPANSCSLVQWEQLAHVAYAAAVSGQRVEPKPVETIFPGVRYVRFRIGESEARLIHYVYFEDDSLRTITASIMRESRDAGYCLFAPRDLCNSAPQLESFKGEIVSY